MLVLKNSFNSDENLFNIISCPKIIFIIMKELQPQIQLKKQNLSSEILLQMPTSNEQQHFMQINEFKTKNNNHDIPNCNIKRNIHQLIKKLVLTALLIFLLSIPIKCESCLSNQFLNNLGVCASCASSIPYCIKCSSDVLCTKCAATYFDMTTDCISCTTINACLNCLSGTNCISCQIGFYVAAGGCISCTSLNSCVQCSSGSVCTLCSPTYGLNMGACFPCSNNQHCHNCNIIAQCLQCQALFGLTIGGKCITCSTIPNCDNCTLYTACTLCNLGFGVNSSSLCQSCKVITNCTNCLNTTYCSLCDASYGVMSNGSCALCTLISNCVDCMLMSQCTKCKSTFVISAGACISCSANANCYDCTAISSCTQCNLGYGLFLAGGNAAPKFSCSPCNATTINCYTCVNANLCTQCIPLFGLTSAQTCQLCSIIPNCLNCTFISTCQICNSQFGVNAAGKCDPCSLISFCFDCKVSNKCTACLPNYGVSSTFTCGQCSIMPNCLNCTNLTSCTGCSLYYGLNSVSLCSPCSTIANCKECTNLTVCTKCLPFFVITTTNLCVSCSLIANCIDCSTPSLCTVCTEKYFVQTGTCALCSIINCRDCKNSTFCNSCIVDYYAVDGQCYPCTNLPACLHCTNETNCIQCIQYYGMNAFGKCIPCSTVVHCIDCLNFTFCIQCKVGYYSSGNGMCKVCPWPCLNCSTAGICSSCYDDPYYSYDNSTHQCVCRLEFTKNGLCTDIDGCKQSAFTNGVERCHFCDIAARFSLVNGSCMCAIGFISKQSVCVEICGDGKRYQLPCDDGNNVNGNGCSANCVIQKDYYCNYGSPSKCVYNGSIPVITLHSIRRKGYQNIGVFMFSISPPLLFLQNMTLTNYLSFQTNASYQISQATYKDGFITMEVTFQTDLQNNAANFTMNYDSHFVSFISDHQIKFPIVSQRKNLLFVSNTQMFSLLSFIVFIIAILSLMIFVLGSLLHRMIGVQTLNISQSVYFSLMLFQQKTPMIQLIQRLQYSVGYTAYFNNLFNNIELEQNLSLLNLNLFSIQNYIFIGIIQFGAILICLILFIYFKIKTNILTAQQKQKQTYRKTTLLKRIIDFIYQKIIFTFIIGFLMINSISFCINFTYYCLKQKSQQFSNDTYLNELNFTFGSFCFCTAIIVIGIQIKDLMMKYLNKKQIAYKPNYIAIYTIYQLLLSSNICFQLINASNFQIQLYLILASSLTYCILIVFYSPYKSKFSNFVLNFNNIGLTMYLSGIAIRNIAVQDVIKFDFYYILITIVWLSLVCIFAFVRIILSLVGAFTKRQQIQIKIKSIRKQQKLKQHLTIELYNQEIQKAVFKSERMQYNAQILNNRLGKIHYFNQQRQKANLLPMKINMSLEELQYLNTFRKDK